LGKVVHIFVEDGTWKALGTKFIRGGGPGWGGGGGWNYEKGNGYKYKGQIEYRQVQYVR